MLLVYVVIIMLLTTWFINMMNSGDKTAFGYTARIVVTGSMRPEIEINSLNIIKVCDISEIEVGDIICFNYNEDIVHRVIEKTTNEAGEVIVHTQGDANKRADSVEVNSDMIIGKVVKTFNGVAGLINEYSISPGQIDGASLARNVIMTCLLIGIVVIVVAWLLSVIVSVIKSLLGIDNLEQNLDKYVKDIDELILYRELLKEICKHNNRTRLEFIFNKIARAKVELELKELHTSIKNFKREIKYCAYIDKLGNKLSKDIEKIGNMNDE